eukprot:CAMPEP_0174230336 /NCGR_PEP_ID=MMETSP0417-20130205/1101_1 /TAXON_ID=242541 /ORGANISM="Mayorella sp, Strain BSH-02190019" /LENGTH=673 /DNA_ID=CAMNT_0015307995 /DNA_START=23 /DNA_END=2046 /DNA_ORIENTATION=-
MTVYSSSLYASSVYGSSSGMCGSYTAPCKTLAQVIALSTPGDSIMLFPGLYDGAVDMTNRATTIAAVHPGASTDGAPHPVIDCSSATEQMPCLRASVASGFVLQDLVFSDFRGRAVAVLDFDKMPPVNHTRLTSLPVGQLTEAVGGRSQARSPHSRNLRPPSHLLDEAPSSSASSTAAALSARRGRLWDKDAEVTLPVGILVANCTFTNIGNPIIGNNTVFGQYAIRVVNALDDQQPVILHVIDTKFSHNFVGFLQTSHTPINVTNSVFNSNIAISLFSLVNDNEMTSFQSSFVQRCIFVRNRCLLSMINIASSTGHIFATLDLEFLQNDLNEVVNGCLFRVQQSARLTGQRILTVDTTGTFFCDGSEHSAQDGYLEVLRAEASLGLIVGSHLDCELTDCSFEDVNGGVFYVTDPTNLRISNSHILEVFHAPVLQIELSEAAVSNATVVIESSYFDRNRDGILSVLSTSSSGTAPPTLFFLLNTQFRSRTSVPSFLLSSQLDMAVSNSSFLNSVPDEYNIVCGTVGNNKASIEFTGSQSTILSDSILLLGLTSSLPASEQVTPTNRCNLKCSASNICICEPNRCTRLLNPSDAQGIIIGITVAGALVLFLIIGATGSMADGNEPVTKRSHPNSQDPHRPRQHHFSARKSATASTGEDSIVDEVSQESKGMKYK